MKNLALRLFVFLLLSVFFVGVGCEVGPLSDPAGDPKVSLGVKQQALLCNDTLKGGQSVRKTMSVTLPNVPPKADVMFSSDLTSSMVEEVAKAKTNSTNIMNQITNLIPDTWFGAMSFKDYAASFNYCGYGQGSAVLYGSGNDFPYKLDQAITSNKASVSSAINTWNVSTDPNTDFPASYTRALWEMYNDNQVGWRSGSKRFVILFADALPHDCSYTVNPYTINTGVDPGRDAKAGTSDDLKWDATITGMKNNNISLITMYSGDAKLSLGGGPPLRIYDFWQLHSQTTGGDAFQLDKQGNLPNNTDIAQFIQQKVQALSASISNLTIELCKDQDQQYASWLTLGDTKTNVTSGTAHNMGITVTPPTGTAPKTYTFAVCIYGDGVEYARDTCSITVTDCTLPGVGDPCSVGTGACQRTGTKKCNAAGNALECSVTAGSPTSEKCNGLDDDCDGPIDEDFPTKGTTCTVGQGECQRNGTCICNSAENGVTCSATAGTPTAELCDAKDNDCDGSIDETFTNKGQPCTSGQGECQRPGTFICNTSGSATTCSATPGSPVSEKCNGLDDDCDGSIDETFSNKGNACTSGTGECQRSGVYQCNTSGSATVCSATAGSPTSEICDGKDNDCDGQTDEGFSNKGNACTSGLGECQKSGTFVCNASGTTTVCSATPGSPTSEICDGKDNNCNGSIDETFSNKGNACTVGQGECRRSGTFVCNASGSTTVCSATAGSPTGEICDGKDNDCDGNIDENWSNKGQSCAVGQGECRRTGTFICNTAKTGTVCSATAGSPASEICDSKDNDCDGQIDEIAQCQPACSAGQTRPCYTGPASTANKGLCKNGTQSCNSSGQWNAACNNEVLPASEICDGVDNDCDGQTDENYTDKGKACAVGQGECKKNGTLVCNSGKNGVTCSATAGSPTSEICDGKDNDCDGQTDEGFGDLGKPCQGGVGACQQSGTFVCKSDGSGTECSAKGAAGATEKCNNIDDDCDGSVDEDFADKGKACTVGQGECKASGTNRCKADGSGLECSAKPNQPSPETCDNKDNDCDGTIDENITKDCSSACGKGSQICKAGTFGACDAPKPKAETCDNKDEDCDGVIDNGLVRPCETDCGKGTETCNAGQWISCSAPKPTAEVCDGKDNDCDGKVDEDIPSKPCKGACGSGNANCESGVFVGCTGLQPKPEVCDGLDNDCDGKIDNLDPRVCRSECGEGKESCVDGFWKNCSAPKPADEVCDDVDNNCDGFVDNSAPCPVGQGCYKGKCSPTCKEDKDCGDGNQCVEGFCAGDPCKDVKCPEGKSCLSGHCVDSCALLTCPDGQVCREGKCREDSCYGLGCPGGQICVEGKCQPDPCLAAECQPNQACRKGECVDSCAWVRCSLGKKCEDGKCIDDACQTTTCNQGQVCLDGKCETDPCANLNCKEGRVCDPKTKQCVDDPCLVLQCPKDQICRDGQCRATKPRELPDLPEQVGKEQVTQTKGDAGPDSGSSTPDGKSPGGCNCNSTNSSPPPSFALLLLLLLFWRRRNHA